MNHIKVLLKLTGRADYSCSQYDECVTAMKSILLVKSCAWFTLQVNLIKHQQPRGLKPGNIIKITIGTTIMSLTLRYQSMDCLQAS